ncbi:hypothetical protein A0H81_07511 [Grifola frondosa]|uniref:Uncharacterized protein n=1 Tax=Grifola frondosa TaxID=5627 RepID=A0A1C7M8K8_GRIFR|nr:hypothetical protein A0H81_07511 [Grifola frondosa]
MEAPINAGPYALRKAGHPTVNVPTDKMAAFLNEVKTACLRKVSDGASASNLGRSISGSGMSTARRAATVGDLSFDIGIAARLGEKRKRDLNVADDTTGAPSAKRRYTTFIIPDNTSANSSSSNTSNETRSTAPGLSSSPPNSQLMHPSSQTWPSVSSTETDITTPSLCSDNDNEHERELPSPPTPDQHGSPAHADTTLTRLTPPQPEREVIDVDQDSPESHIVHPIEQPLPILERKDVQSAFARRVPSSPMPPDTPRKPLPPARSRPRTKPTRKPIPVEDEDASDGVDPLSLTYSPPSMKVVRAAPRIADPPLQPRIKKGTNKDSSRLPVPARASRVPDTPPITPTISQQQQQQQHQHQEAPTTSNTIRRRRTLDEELRRAGDSLWQDTPVAPPRDNQQHADVQEDLDSSELVGVGTKSKRRGFLSGGGAAGAPVFMGVGYVQGAMDDDEIQIIEPPQKKTSKTKTKR